METGMYEAFKAFSFSVSSLQRFEKLTLKCGNDNMNAEYRV